MTSFSFNDSRNQPSYWILKYSEANIIVKNVVAHLRFEFYFASFTFGSFALLTFGTWEELILLEGWTDLIALVREPRRWPPLRSQAFQTPEARVPALAATCPTMKDVKTQLSAVIRWALFQELQMGSHPLHPRRLSPNWLSRQMSFQDEAATFQRVLVETVLEMSPVPVLPPWNLFLVAAEIPQQASIRAEPRIQTRIQPPQIRLEA